MYTARASFEWSHLWVLSERSGFGNLLVLVSSDCKYKRNSHRVVRCEVIIFLNSKPHREIVTIVVRLCAKYQMTSTIGSEGTEVRSFTQSHTNLSNI